MAKVKQLLTLQQLADFCAANNFARFSSEETGYTLSVQIPAELKFEESESGDLETLFKACHTELNRNGSYVSEKNMKKAMPSLKYKPVLASIIENDNGELDFNGHDIEFGEDEDGNSKIIYIEKPVGVFTKDAPYLEYDEEMDKTYVKAKALIWDTYSDAAKIIRRKNGTKVSSELRINSMSYNAKEGYLELEDFEFDGVTLLGEHVGEGMLGSRCDIKDFSTENNSVMQFASADELEELKNKIAELEVALGEIRKEGGSQEMEFEEKTPDLEEIEEKVEEKFEEEPEIIEVESEEEIVENESEDEIIVESEEETEDEGESVEYSATVTLSSGEDVKNFSVSLSEKLYALSTLVNDTYAEADNAYYSVDVYDEEKYVIMVDYWSGNAYKQTYKVKKDSYSLTGDRVSVRSIYVTEDEEKELDKIRSNYSVIAEKLEKYESEPKKLEILSSNDYAGISDKAEFVELKKEENHFDLSVEEVSAKADEILMKYAKSGQLNFAVEDKSNKKTYVPLSRTNKSDKKKDSRYGNLKF